ncbi:MAG: MFS transporter [Bauldia sp.]|uniref:MFS transporter n=1 Tax=Bauldia sp. TaxID=2575872 RepID=UPI001D82E484|nr:MFS transporter [Bauldia sp.]MCB1496636.1 MFS transporter [Bauldia sp.]
MASTLIPIAALLLGSSFLLMAGGLHGLLLPLQGSATGFTTLELGLIGTGWSIGFMAGSLLVPRIVRRVGHVRGYGSMASIAAVAILLNILIVSPPAWIVLRALSGFCFAGAYMIVESWLNERATAENRGTIFSIYQMVVFTSSTVGQLLLVLTPPSDFFFFAIGAILYCLAILPTALSTAKNPQPLNAARLDIRALYRASPVAVVGCFMIGLVNGTFGTLGPVYAVRIGLPVAEASVLMAAAMLGGSLVQFPAGRLSDRMDRRRVMIGGAVATIVVGLAIFLLRPRQPEIVTGLAILFGASIYPMYGLAVAHANDFATDHDFVKIAGGLLLVLGLGLMIGPILGSLAMDWTVPEGLFAFAALVHGLLAIYIVYRMTRRAARRREPFRGMSLKALTLESAALDPRAEPLPETFDEAASPGAPAPEAPTGDAPAAEPPSQQAPPGPT